MCSVLGDIELGTAVKVLADYGDFAGNGRGSLSQLKAISSNVVKKSPPNKASTRLASTGFFAIKVRGC